MNFAELQNTVSNAWLTGTANPITGSVETPGGAQAIQALEQAGAYNPNPQTSFWKPWTDLGASFLDSAAQTAAELNKQLPGILSSLAINKLATRKVSGGSESGGTLLVPSKPAVGVQPTGATTIVQPAQQAGISTGMILVLGLAGIALFIVAKGVK